MGEGAPGPCPYCQTQMENSGAPIWEDYCPNKACTGHRDQMFRRLRERPAVRSEITARYWNMIPADVNALCVPDPGTDLCHIRWMIGELRKPMEIGKAMRWLGFIQGILIERGFTTVTAERDFTRPFFSSSQ